jgi:hypothetical protein
MLLCTLRILHNSDQFRAEVPYAETQNHKEDQEEIFSITYVGLLRTVWLYVTSGEGLAANTGMPVETMTQLHVVAMKQSSLKAQTPTEEEINIAEVFAGLLQLAL